MKKNNKLVPDKIPNIVKTYNKLVRNKIPNIIKADGVKCKTHVASNDEYRMRLPIKLKEEVNEFMQNVCVEEIVDILEVIEAIAKAEGISLNEIKQKKLEKRKTHGSFTKHIVLEWTEEK